MNAARRKALNTIIDQLEDLKTELEDLLSEEEEYRDNMPENLQSSERYENADRACDSLQDAVYELESSLDSITDAVDC